MHGLGYGLERQTPKAGHLYWRAVIALCLIPIHVDGGGDRETEDQREKWPDEAAENFTQKKTEEK